MFGRKMSPPPPPLANEALCLSTPKHNGQSGNDHGQEMQLANVITCGCESSVLFIYSLQIFGYDSLWYNCSIVIIFYFPCISLFYSFVCSSHLCILSYMHVPYGAFFINKEFEFEFEKHASKIFQLH